MNHIEAMKQVLEALEDMYCGWKYIREFHGDLYGVGWDRVQEKVEKTIKTLRQVLEQPEQTVSLEEYKRLQRLVTSQGIRLMEYESEQEPVAWMSHSPTKGNGKQLHWTKAEAWRWSSNITPLYTAPPKREWQGLTYEEISASVDICEQNVKGEFLVDYARAIEAKLREKNGF